MIRLLLAGEGPSELGRLGPERSPLSHPPEGLSKGSGVIEALLSRVRPAGWLVVDRVVWKDIRKLVPNVPGAGDNANVRRVVQRARDLGCHAVVFIRDRDDDVGRVKKVETAIAEETKLNARMAIVGGVAVRELEAWLLALDGYKNADRLPSPKDVLLQKHGVPENAEAMVQFVIKRKLGGIAADAMALRRWFRRAALGLRVRLPRE